MQKFIFPLARVLDWRRTQVRVEQSTLERLYAELHRIEARLRETHSTIQQAGRELIAAGSATGLELNALDHFRKASAIECAKLADSAAASRQRIAAQLQIVIQKRHDVKLLEHLLTRKLDAWNAEFAREIDNEASELHLAKRQRQAAPREPCKIDHGP
jgi:flagellar export protein FliJ